MYKTIVQRHRCSNERYRYTKQPSGLHVLPQRHHCTGWPFRTIHYNCAVIRLCFVLTQRDLNHEVTIMSTTTVWIHVCWPYRRTLDSQTDHHYVPDTGSLHFLCRKIMSVGTWSWHLLEAHRLVMVSSLWCAFTTVCYGEIKYLPYSQGRLIYLLSVSQ